MAGTKKPESRELDHDEMKAAAKTPSEAAATIQKREAEARAEFDRERAKLGLTQQQADAACMFYGAQTAKQGIEAMRRMAIATGGAHSEDKRKSGGEIKQLADGRYEARCKTCHQLSFYEGEGSDSQMMHFVPKPIGAVDREGREVYIGVFCHHDMQLVEKAQLAADHVDLKLDRKSKVIDTVEDKSVLIDKFSKEN